MTPKRQAIFVRPSLSVGGADRWAIDALIALQDRGWDVEIVVNFHNPAWTQPEVANGQVSVTAYRGIPLWCTGKRLRAAVSVVNQWMLLRRVRRRGTAPDLIVGDVVPQAITAMRREFPDAAVLFYCHFPDRLAVTAHGLYGIYRELMGRREDRAMQAAHRILANSAYTAAAICRTFPLLAAERLAIVRPGVRPPGDRVSRGENPPEAIARKKVFLTVARFDPRKDLELAVAAFAELRARIGPVEFASWRLVLAGGFDRRLPEVNALVERLRAQTVALGVAAQVELRFDPSEEALGVLWRDAFALIHPAAAEHFGIALIEAMARGLPVLAVDHGGPRETVLDEVTGALRPPEAGPFADVLARWVREPDLAAALGAAGRRRAEADFSMERFSKEFFAQVELTLDRPPPSR